MSKVKAKETTIDLNKLRSDHVPGPGSRRLFIPACGDRIVLTRDWTFTLYLESRNMGLAKSLGLVDPKTSSWGVYEDGSSRVLKRVQVTLPAKLVLECDRVYIRTFNKSALKADNDYDSITWKILKNGKPATKLRFWCKLVDACEIEYDLQFDSLYRNRVKLLKSVHEA